MEYNVQHWADTRSIERISCYLNVMSCVWQLQNKRKYDDDDDDADDDDYDDDASTRIWLQ